MPTERRLLHSDVACVIPLLLWLLVAASPTAEARPKLELNLPFLKKKEYTPLVFFTAPRGLVREADAMEDAVRRLERDLGVRVERLDVLRDPVAAECLALLASKDPPFLYNRLTQQSISVPVAASGQSRRRRDDDEEPPGAAARTQLPVHIDMERLRAWAKNRLLTEVAPTMPGTKTSPVLVELPEEPDMELDQSELLEDLTLTPTQREGKTKIKERTKSRESGRK